MDLIKIQKALYETHCTQKSQGGHRKHVLYKGLA